MPMPEPMDGKSFERLVLIADESGATIDDPAPVDLLEALTHWAACQPGHIAVRAPDGTLTYAELDRLARVLAANLDAALEGRCEPVAVCGPLGCLHVAALAAGMHLGVPIVPLDPALSSLRNRQTVQLVGASVAVCAGPPEAVRPHVGPAVRLVSLASLDDTLAPVPARAPDDAVAMIVFTSGSTGTPKGVAKKRRSMGEACRIRRHMLAIGPQDVAAFAGSSAVSGAHFNCWTALISGATLIAIPSADSIAAILDLYQRNRVSVTAFYVGLGRIVAGHPEARDRLGALRAVTLFGDVVQWDDVAAMRGVLNPDAGVFCSYGATEVSWSTGWMIDAGQPLGRGRAPIGRCLPGATLWLDPSGDAGKGELVVTSPRMSLGYWNDDGRTAERFHLLPDGSGRIVFRTGDQVRLRGDGLLEFLGRDDNMVKLRGRRVEIEEIETVARKAPGVVAAGVVPRRDQAGAVVALALYVGAGEGGAIDGDVLRKVIQDELPRYMWPVEVVALAQMPMNQSAKVDRNRLRERDLQRLQQSAQAAGGTQGDAEAPLEQRIADCMAAELGVRTLDPQADFSGHGGDSLKALGTALALERQFGVTLDPEGFFDGVPLAETVARVAREIRARA